MITSAFLNLLAYALQAVGWPLPSGTLLPDNFSDLFSDLVAYAYGWDWLMPMGTLFSVMGVIFAFMLAEFIARGGLFLLKLIRGN